MNILSTVALLSALTTPHPTALTTEVACKALMEDAVDLGIAYTRNQSKQEAAKWLTDRFENDPFYLVYLPGDLRILSVIDEAGITEDTIVDMAVATHTVCTREKTRGWIQPIPGVTIDVKKPSLFNQESEKIAM